MFEYPILTTLDHQMLIKINVILNQNVFIIPVRTYEKSCIKC